MQFSLSVDTTGKCCILCLRQKAVWSQTGMPCLGPQQIDAVCTTARRASCCSHGQARSKDRPHGWRTRSAHTGGDCVFPWHGEGYRKAWARLRSRGIRISKCRILHIMREGQMLAHHRKGNPHGPRAHDRRIVTDAPDVMWGTDATGTLTREGPATVFITVEHYTGECMGIHAAARGTRFEALEPIRQGVIMAFEGVGRDCAKGLALRHDHGSQYVSHSFQDELKFLGITSSPSFVREPEGNGCSDGSSQHLKQVLWVEQLAWCRNSGRHCSSSVRTTTPRGCSSVMATNLPVK